MQEMESNNNDFRPTKLKNVLGMLNKYYKFINTSTDLNIVEFKTEQECPLNYCNIFDPESKNNFENYFNQCGCDLEQSRLYSEVLS